MAVRVLEEVQSIEVVQEFFLRNALTCFKIKQLGANEYILKFDSREEMLSILEDA